jgi:imidazolonepropionase-like amidohydrolase
MPLAMIANSQYQIIRTLEFKAQFGFKLWLAGVTGANDMPMEMIPKDVEMIVSLTQRREPTNEGDTKVPGPVFAERKATYEKSLRNFADLESAGFKPSITAAGVTPNQIWGNLRNWVRVGASKSSILEAMTSRPAALLGISKEVGSLEVGKRAHIAVFDGDPFAEKTKMKMIVVDGVVKNLGGEK